MEDIFKDVEPMVFRSRINVPYHWWAGDTASRFFMALRDEKKILGTRCASCGRVFVPPRKSCPQCHHEKLEWAGLSTRGTVVSYTVARRQLAAIPKKVPVIFALITLDGADTSLIHFLDGADPDEVKIGMRVEACFAEKRSGGIMDIACFRPVR